MASRPCHQNSVGTDLGLNTNSKYFFQTTNRIRDDHINLSIDFSKDI
jgi:hypothetical protein